MEDMDEVRMELARMCSEHVEGLRIAVHIVVIAGCLLAVSSTGASMSTLVWIGLTLPTAESGGFSLRRR